MIKLAVFWYSTAATSQDGDHVQKFVGATSSYSSRRNEDKVEPFTKLVGREGILKVCLRMERKRTNWIFLTEKNSEVLFIGTLKFLWIPIGETFNFLYIRSLRKQMFINMNESLKCFKMNRLVYLVYFSTNFSLISDIFIAFPQRLFSWTK